MQPQHTAYQIKAHIESSCDIRASSLQTASTPPWLSAGDSAPKVRKRGAERWGPSPKEAKAAAESTPEGALKKKRRSR